MSLRVPLRGTHRPRPEPALTSSCRCGRRLQTPPCSVQMASQPRAAAANFSCWRLRALFLKFHVYLKPDFQMSSSALKSDFFLLQILKPDLEPHSSKRGKLRLTWFGSMTPLASGTREVVLVAAHEKGCLGSPACLGWVLRQQGLSWSRGVRAPEVGQGPGQQFPPGEAAPGGASWDSGLLISSHVSGNRGHPEACPCAVFTRQ